MAKEANAFSAGDNRACSDGESRENECSNSTTIAENSVGTTQPICHGDRQKEELLHLWRFWAHGPSLQKQRKRKDRAEKKSGVQGKKIQGKL